MKISRIFLCFSLVLCFSLFSYGQKKTAENFTATDMNGNTVELSALKGKVVLITFWSTKCAICHSEIPKLNQIAASYKGKDVVFLGLTTDNPTRIESYLQTKPFDFNIIPNSFGTLLKYADRDPSGNIAMGYPAYFLVNQAGEIEMKTSGWDKTPKLDTQIKNLLNTGK